MGVVDIVLGSLILFGLVRGFMKGLFVEVASLVALVAGVYGAIHFSDFAAQYLQTKTDWNEKTISITAFAITFVVIILVISLAGKALTKLADFAALGTLKIALILSVVLIVFDKMNSTITFIDEENMDDSVLYTPVKSLVPMIFPNILIPKEDGEIQEKEI